MAILTLAHAMWRGPVGAGYQMASIPAPVFVGAYLVCAANGVAIDQIAALVVISGVVAVGLVLLMPRPEKIFPSELAGVSVFLLGASLLPLVFDLLSNKGQLAPAAIMLEMAIIVPAFMAMMVMALSRLPIAPFAVIIGATLGLMLAAWLMPEQLQFATALASNPWLAVPQPILPRFEGLTLGLVIIFVIPILPTFISLLGSLAALQRAADADWKSPIARLCGAGYWRAAYQSLRPVCWAAWCPARPPPATRYRSPIARSLARSLSSARPFSAPWRFRPKLPPLAVCCQNPFKLSC
jgi:hypothetical protein